MLGSLRNREFRYLWIGSLSAFLAFFTSNVVQSVVAFELTAENSAVGSVVFARGLAQLMFAPVGGAVADRVSKRRILVQAQSLTAVVFVALAWLMASGAMQVVHLVIGGFIIGLTFAFLGPTRSAYIVELVEPGKQGEAIALNQVALNVSRVAGPAFAGLLLAWRGVGAAGAFAAMGVLYVAAVATQSLLPKVPPPAHPDDRGVLADIRDGLVYVRDHPRLRALLWMFVLTVMLGFPYVTVLPGLVEHQLHRDASAVTVLFSAAAVGGLIASLIASRLADSAHALAVYRAAGIGFGVMLMLLWTARDMLAASVLLFILGLSSGCFITLNGAVLLRTAEPRYVGRVMSLAMLAFGGFGIVGLPVGVFADAAGEGPALAVMGALVCLVVAIQSRALVRSSEG